MAVYLTPSVSLAVVSGWFSMSLGERFNEWVSPEPSNASCMVALNDPWISVLMEWLGPKAVLKESGVMELCGAFGCRNRHFPRTGWVWGGDTNQTVLQRKDTRPKQSPALPSISWDTPTIPYQAQGSSQNSQQVSNFSRRKIYLFICLVFFFFRFSFLCFPSHPPSSSPSYPSLFLSISLSPSLFSLPVFSPPFFPSSLGSCKGVHTQLNLLPRESPSETLTATVKI